MNKCCFFSFLQPLFSFPRAIPFWLSDKFYGKQKVAVLRVSVAALRTVDSANLRFALADPQNLSYNHLF